MPLFGAVPLSPLLLGWAGEDTALGTEPPSPLLLGWAGENTALGRPPLLLGWAGEDNGSGATSGDPALPLPLSVLVTVFPMSFLGSVKLPSIELRDVLDRESERTL